METEVLDGRPVAGQPRAHELALVLLERHAAGSGCGRSGGAQSGAGFVEAAGASSR